MVITGLALLPVVVWYFKFNFNFRTRILGAFFLILFSKGFLELCGIPNAISSLICELLLGLMLLRFKRTKNSQYPGILFIIGILFISALSTISNQTSVVQFFLFFREYFEVIIFFYLIANIRFSENELSFFTRFLTFLFLSQIAANVIKLLLVQDIVEPYIGTIAVLGGSKTTILALIGGSFCIVQYLITSKRIYLWGILGFIVFSLLGGKRATILYFPIIYILSYLIFQLKYREKREIVFKKLFVIFGGIALLFYATARLLPTLNPEKEIGGSFDIEYIIEYSKSYSTADYINEVGRSEAPAFLILKALSDGTEKVALGYGTGHLIKSGFNPETANLTSDEITSTKYGVGYAARTGFLQFFLQIGGIGVLFFGLFLLTLLRNIWKMSNPPVVFRFTSVLLLMVMLIDYFTYSTESILFSAVGCAMFFFLGLTFQLRSQ